ncbi:MAG: bifunctional 3-(3-hydroxy-phenyl)propionate/3-hydroxycinnamic acid hydroxylase [Pseudonocardia sp.]
MTQTPSGNGHGSFDTDVLVVGAGPVGLILANLLGVYGIRTTLVEQGPELIDYPRGVQIDDETLRTFQSAGLVEQVLPHTTPDHVLRMINHKGQVLAEVKAPAKDYGWPRRNAFIQPLVDKELLAGLSRFTHVDVHFSHTMVGHIEDADGVRATVDLADGTTRAIRARYLVGCDGGRSPTRRGMDVTFEGRTAPARWLVVDVRNDPLGTPSAYLGADPQRPFVSIGLPHGIRRFEFMLHDDETDEHVADPQFVASLLAKHVPDPSNVDFIRKRVYTLHARIAGAFRRGRVLVAGDAAHLMPVWQGQGYNSGIRDATNLAWKLSAVLRGAASHTLLDSYDTERRDHVKAMTDVSVTMGRILAPKRRTTGVLRDIAAAGLNLAPPAKRWLAEMRYKPAPRFRVGALVEPTGAAAARNPVGQMFPQPRVDTRDRQNVVLDDVLGPWFAVLVWGNDPLAVLDKQALATLESLGARLVGVRPLTQLHYDPPREGSFVEGTGPTRTGDVTLIGDREGRLKAWFDQHLVGVVFLRPDRYVAAACIAQDASRVTGALATALSLTTDGARP